METLTHGQTEPQEWQISGSPSQLLNPFAKGRKAFNVHDGDNWIMMVASDKGEAHALAIVKLAVAAPKMFEMIKRIYAGRQTLTIEERAQLNVIETLLNEVESTNG